MVPMNELPHAILTPQMAANEHRLSGLEKLRLLHECMMEYGYDFEGDPIM